MALRALVFAGLRVLAIYLVAQVISLMPLVVPFVRASINEGGVTLWVVLTVIGMIVMAVVLWLFAGRLASGVVRECDPTIQFSLTLEDAYSLAFVVLGLYFVLDALPGAVISIYRLISATSQYPVGDVVRSQRLLDMYRTGITLGAGLAALLGHRIWARKLTHSDVPPAQ
jgi:hypothetical protein